MMSSSLNGHINTIQDDISVSSGLFSVKVCVFLMQSTVKGYTQFQTIEYKEKNIKRITVVSHKFGHPAQTSDSLPKLQTFTCQVKFAQEKSFCNNCECTVSFENVSALEWCFFVYCLRPFRHFNAKFQNSEFRARYTKLTFL